MPHRERHVEEERLARGLLLLDERDGTVGQLVVDLGPHLEREGLDALQWDIPLLLIHPRSLLDQVLLGDVAEAVRQHDLRHVRRGVPRGVRRDAIELIETVCTRQALRLYTEVPLAEDGRRVARVLEQLPHRVGVARKRIGRAWYGGKRQPIADRILPGHQRRARRCAGGFDQILRETQTLTGEPVDIWRRCAAQLAPAVGSEIAVALETQTGRIFSKGVEPLHRYRNEAALHPLCRQPKWQRAGNAVQRGTRPGPSDGALRE